MKYILKNKSGFTIVEAIVVIGVIAILARTIGPTYERYMLQSRMMEGPITLAKIYSAEKELFADRGTYVACVYALGIEPEYEGYFVTGFDPAINYGKEPSLVPNCDASVSPYIRRTCPPSGSKESVCTGGRVLQPYDTMLVPLRLLMRGSSTNSSSRRQPYVDVTSNCNWAAVTAANPAYSTLTDGNDYLGNTTSFGATPLIVGRFRPDTKFKACALASFSDKVGSVNTSLNNYIPTQYTIDHNKKIEFRNRGW